MFIDLGIKLIFYEGDVDNYYVHTLKIQKPKLKPLKKSA